MQDHVLLINLIREPAAFLWRLPGFCRPVICGMQMTSNCCNCIVHYLRHFSFAQKLLFFRRRTDTLVLFLWQTYGTTNSCICGDAASTSAGVSATVDRVRADGPQREVDQHDESYLSAVAGDRHAGSRPHRRLGGRQSASLSRQKPLVIVSVTRR